VEEVQDVSGRHDINKDIAQVAPVVLRSIGQTDDAKVGTLSERLHVLVHDVLANNGAQMPFTEQHDEVKTILENRSYPPRAHSGFELRP
jgi:hypothetical protein